MRLIALVIVFGIVGVTTALKCYQCGQYHDGVGSITPCLNYTAPTSPAFLKDCPRSSQRFCIVSALSSPKLSPCHPQFEFLLAWFK